MTEALSQPAAERPAARRGEQRHPMHGPRVVALGGGHGLAASLTALRLVTEDVTAVVTVADNGGSSGRLRRELGVLPPGDLRMALAALCEDSRWGRLWRDVLQHRFVSDGPLHGHAVGNLLIAALWQLLDDPVTGLDVVGDLLGARGRVLPMAGVPLDIAADVAGLPGAGHGVIGTVVGQVEVATTPGEVRSVRLLPHDPPANPAAVAAVSAADWVILGPGSWFTSVLPHLMVPDLAAALTRTPAKRCVTLNLATHTGETSGLPTQALLAVLRDYAPEMRLDAVIADPGAVPDVDALVSMAASFGAKVWFRQVSVGDGSARHEPLRLAAAYGDVFSGALADVTDSPAPSRRGRAPAGARGPVTRPDRPVGAE